jgi:hypothetical protein
MTNDLLSDIGDGPFPHAAISTALDRGQTQFEVVPGSELRQAGSLTALLRDAGDPACTVFLKKVTAGLVANKAWNDRRRVLLYIRNELRFYDEFADGLRQRGVDIPCLYFFSSNNLDDIEEYEEEPPPKVLDACGALMFLEPLADATQFHQMSPLSPSQASTLLEAAARLHAAAWEDAPTLQRAAARLQRHGGSFALSARNPKELADLPESWDKFAAAFAPASPPGFFARPEIAALGSRLQAAAPWISAQLSPAPNGPFATLIHGDLKAMNVFLPVRGPDGRDGRGGITVRAVPILIDFASTGVGLGMADVAMHLVHALVPADLDGGGEEALIDGYLASLAAARGVAAVKLSPYPRELALRHFRLATIDYGRFIMGRFWAAATPERFAAAAASPNVVLANRDLASALRFVERISRYLAEYEEEIQDTVRAQCSEAK